MIKSKSLKVGEVYITDITLNRENGEIEVPWRPTQRFVTPVTMLVGAGPEEYRKSSMQRSQTLGIVSQIRFYDEQLTNAAHQAAITGDMAWAVEYDKVALLLDTALAAAIEFTGPSGVDVLEVINDANNFREPIVNGFKNRINKNVSN